MKHSIGTIREFRTAQFTVIVDAVEEDSPDISFDETTETSDKIESGEWMIFCARARVIHDELGEVASDYLGNCIYESLDAFMDHKECGAQNRARAVAGEQGRCGSYFRDMIRSVCTEARTAIRNAQTIRVRSC
jgi:hypothetical protein